MCVYVYVIKPSSKFDHHLNRSAEVQGPSGISAIQQLSLAARTSRNTELVPDPGGMFLGCRNQFN